MCGLFLFFSFSLSLFPFLSLSLFLALSFFLISLFVPFFLVFGNSFQMDCVRDKVVRKINNTINKAGSCYDKFQARKKKKYECKKKKKP